jgi:hypothetical protein
LCKKIKINGGESDFVVDSGKQATGKDSSRFALKVAATPGFSVWPLSPHRKITKAHIAANPYQARFSATCGHYFGM